ncbi:MAG: TonB-dependent receptor, partial [Bacteroidetes bacterium]
MKKIYSFFIIAIILSFQLFSQSTGKIAGKIIDKETKQPIPFAAVKVEGTSLGANADDKGSFIILNIPSGVYNVSASLVGYQKQTINDIRVNVDFTTRIEFKLSIGKVDLPAIIVQGDRNPLIRQDLTNPTVAINSETIKELPVDQISDVIRLQAGVVTDNDGALHVRGGRSNEIAYTLNGISLNDPYGNSRSIGLAVNAVQEVSVSTGTFNAQYGNALSGVVNYVTKEGSEKYSFSIRGYIGDYFSKRSNLFPSIDKFQPFNRSRGELTFGGPIPEIDGAKFYFSSVYENFKGSLYGIRLYKPTDSYLTRENFTKAGDTRKGLSTDPYFFNPYDKLSNGKPTGDGGLIPMNPSQSLNLQGNLSYKITPTIKARYEAVYNWGKSKSYSTSYKYNPDGVGTSYGNGLVQSLDFTHTLNDNIFYTLKFSLGYNQSKYYLFENRSEE